jgi:hypothetical protein
MYRESLGIKTVLEPIDTSLYNSLLPEQSSMPDQPLVFLYIADFVKLVAWPIKLVPWRMTRYREQAVFLRCFINGEEGWFCLTMPVTTWPAMALGRYLLGFPKYVADEINLEGLDGGWLGWVKHQGVEKMRLEFEPGLSRDIVPWEERILGSGVFFDDRLFTLYPAEKGPSLKAIWFDQIAPTEWSPILGMVRVAIDPNDPWADLIDSSRSYPGMYNYFVGASSLAAELLDER